MRLMNRFGAIHYFPDDSVFYSTILANEEFDLLLHYFEWFGWIQVDFLVITRYWNWNARKWNYFYGFGCFEGKFRMFVWIWSIFREDLVEFWLNFGDWCKSWDLKSYGLEISGRFWEFFLYQKCFSPLLREYVP